MCGQGKTTGTRKGKTILIIEMPEHKISGGEKIKVQKFIYAFVACGGTRTHSLVVILIE